MDSPEAWIQGVPDALTEEVIAEDGDQNGQAGIKGEPPGDIDIVLAGRQDISPTGYGRLNADAEETEGGLVRIAPAMPSVVATRTEAMALGRI